MQVAAASRRYRATSFLFHPTTASASSSNVLFQRSFSKIKTDTSQTEANREKGFLVEDYSYASKRRAYLQEVAQYRRKFAFDYKKKQDKIARDKEAERAKIQKEKEARLVIKRAKMAENAARAAAELQARMDANAARFEEKVVVRQELEHECNIRRSLLAKSAALHGSKWVSNDNIEDKLGEAFFEQAGVQVSSDGWTPKTNPNRVGNESPRSWLERLHRMAPRNARKKDGE